MRRYRFLTFVFAYVTLGGACSAPPEEPSRPSSSPASGGAGMVSSAHPLATQAGLDILRAGGNAFDAAVAIAAALNVVEPMMSGMGGYGTILVYDQEAGEARFLNCSGRIPKTLDSDVFRPPTPDFEVNRRGAKAVSTPGNLNCWEAMSKEYGELPWPRLFQDPIRTAEEGFAIGKRTADLIESAFSDFPEHAQHIYGENGRPLKEGGRLVQRELAQSLRLVAEQGAGALHGGPLGESVHEAMAAAGGFLTVTDLEENQAEWYEPIGIDYRGHRVLTASPPATAFPSLVRLGLMSRFDTKALGHNSVAYLHRFAEVTKHAFWTRLRYAGDPEVSPPPLDLLLSEDYWRERVAAIDPDHATPFEPPGLPTGEDSHTTHFVVADADGNIVSATQTLGNSFGSRIMPEGTGIWLNNSLAYCTFEPKGNAMDAFPGRHKLSGDCPTLILRNGKPWAALGTPGGHTIGQTVPQMVMNLIDFQMNIQEAIAAPRLSFVEPDVLSVEETISQEVREGLAALGHNVRAVRGLGNAHGLTIELDPDGRPARFFGAADPRGEGKAEGLEK